MAAQVFFNRITVIIPTESANLLQMSMYLIYSNDEDCSLRSDIWQVAPVFFFVFMLIFALRCN